ASAVRNVSWQAVTPQDTATISVTMPFSFSRTASSTAISSNGFIDILTLAVSTPEPSDLTRTLTLKSTTRLTGTRTFMGARTWHGAPKRRRKADNYSGTGAPRFPITIGVRPARRAGLPNLMRQVGAERCEH